MPELPEMQALAERTAATFGGAAVIRADVLSFSGLKTVTPPPESLSGKPLEDVDRRGKYLLMRFGGLTLAMHLSQGGRVDFEIPRKTTRPKGAVMRLVFDNQSSLLLKEFGTERKAAWWLLAGNEQGPLEGLGPEPSDPEFEDLIRGGQDGRRLHTLLRDQRTVAGIGRGFADDILNHARLSPFDSLNKLSTDERVRLLDSVRSVLESGLERERQRTGGLPAKLGDRFAIHKRYGQPCPRCGGKLERVSYESHEIVYCPACQTGGKVLADRRLSRLLK